MKVMVRGMSTKVCLVLVGWLTAYDVAYCGTSMAKHRVVCSAMHFGVGVY